MANKLARGLGVGSVGAAALTVLIPFLQGNEGLSLKAYQDVAGVYTVCYGKAYVKPGVSYSKAECDDMLQREAVKYMSAIYPMFKVPISAETLAAYTDLAYNIGPQGFKGSTALRLTNAGHYAEGCAAIKKWSKVNGKDCYDKRNNCYGIAKRRDAEASLCVKGLND